MSRRVLRIIDRRYRRTPLLFANDHGSVEDDRREDTRRGATRYQVHLWVELQVGGERQLAFVPELSTVGTFVVLAQPLDLGARVILRMSLPQDPIDIVAHGRVASIRMTGGEADLHSGNGVAFTQLTDEAEAQIKRYCRWIHENADVVGLDLPGE